MSRDAAQDYADAFQRLDRMQAAGKSHSGHERNCVFLNTGGSNFASISATSGLDFDDDGRGVAYVDWDQDGDLDLWIVNRTGPQVRFMRNDVPRTGDFLSIRLVGTTVNRDAIGARVQVHLRSKNGEPVVLTKSLYAGHGFASQSSKWLHFGLGADGQINRVTVRWPGAGSETYTGIEVNRRYHITQGTGEAVRSARPARVTRLNPSTLQGQPPSNAGRVFLMTPTKVPLLTYADFSGKDHTINERLEGPVLVNLWASWCLPCHAELKEMIGRQAELRRASVRVLALSVDGLDEAKATTPADAMAYLERVQFPFESGRATAEMLNKLQLLHDHLFYKIIAIGVPTSFLLDEEGRLAVIYRGRVDVDQLIADASQLRARGERRQQLASPLSGRWHLAPPTVERQGQLGQRFYENGYADDALLYFREAERLSPNDATNHLRIGLCLNDKGHVDGAITSFQKALTIDPNHVQAHNNLGVAFQSQGQSKEALAQYRKVLALDPHFTVAHYNVAMLLKRSGNHDESIQHLRQAIRSRPYFAKAHLQLGAMLRERRRFDAALHHLRQAVQIEPTNAWAHYSMGLTQEMAGRSSAAIGHYRAALRYQDDELFALNRLAWLLATHKDPEARRPTEALELALRASEITGHKDAAVTFTAAVAHAASGEYDQAVAAAETALELAGPEQQNLVVAIRKGLALFRQRRPYSESAP